MENWEFIGLEEDVKAKDRLEAILPCYKDSSGQPRYTVVDREERYKKPDVVLRRKNDDGSVTMFKVELEHCMTDINWEKRKNNVFGDVQVPYRKDECLRTALEEFPNYFHKYVQFSPDMMEFCVSNSSIVLGSRVIRDLPVLGLNKKQYKSDFFQVLFDHWAWHRVIESNGDISTVSFNLG